MSQNVYMDAKAERLFIWLSVAVVSLVAFEAVAVGTAMPTVVRKLDGQNLYALAMGIPLAAQLITTALAGIWSDAKTPQSCLYTGIIVFSLGLVICTTAPSMILFVLGRTIQGLGGGLCIVPIYTLIGSYVHPHRQGVLFSSLSSAWVVPSLIGPVIAGWFVQALNWRFVFGLVPALFVAIFPALIFILSRLPSREETKKMYGVGKVMFPAFLTGVTIAVLQVLSGTKPADFDVYVFLAIAAAVLLTFVFVKPLLPHGMYVARRGLASSLLTRGIANGTFIGTEAFLPLLLQEAHGWSPTAAGFILTVGSVTWAVGSWWQGRIIDPAKRRELALWATFMQLGGIALIVPSSFPAVTPWLVVAGWTLTGLGTGLIFPAMSVHALAMTPQERQGNTSSAIQLSDTLGASFCIAAAGIAYAIVMPNEYLAFAVTIGLMALMFALTLLTVRRIMPHRGSVEERQLNELSAMLAAEAERK